jgi:alpha-aminoadipate carrier protein LysW
MDARCTDCDASVPIPEDALVGEIVSCKECGAEYEVAELTAGAATLKPAEQVEEDWGE